MNEEHTVPLEELGKIKAVKVYNQAYADKQQERIKELEQQVEKMKCCGNCRYFDRDEPKYCNKGVFNAYICDKWKFAND